MQNRYCKLFLLYECQPILTALLHNLYMCKFQIISDELWCAWNVLYTTMCFAIVRQLKMEN